VGDSFISQLRFGASRVAVSNATLVLLTWIRLVSKCILTKKNVLTAFDVLAVGFHLFGVLIPLLSLLKKYLLVTLLVIIFKRKSQ